MTVKRIEGATLNLKDINIVLSEQINGLRSGDITVSSANAIANSVGKMFTGVKLQMEYYRVTGQTPEIPFLSE